MRDQLKDKNCNPDILAQQEGKENNPHKTKHITANDNVLGYSESYRSIIHQVSQKVLNEAYYLDVIGTSYCRSRAIALY